MITILEALLYNAVWFLFLLSVLWYSKDDLPVSFWRTGIWFLVFAYFIFGTWFRWYYQLPFLGWYGYLIG